MAGMHLALGSSSSTIKHISIFVLIFCWNIFLVFVYLEGESFVLLVFNEASKLLKKIFHWSTAWRNLPKSSFLKVSSWSDLGDSPHCSAEPSPKEQGRVEPTSFGRCTGSCTCESEFGVFQPFLYKGDSS